MFIGDTVTIVTTVVESRPTSRPEQGVVDQLVAVVNPHDIVQTGVFVTLIATRP